VLIGILILLIISEKEIYSKIQKKGGERSWEERYRTRKTEKKGYKKERVNKKISYNHYIIIIFDLNSM